MKKYGKQQLCLKHFSESVCRKQTKTVYFLWSSDPKAEPQTFLPFQDSMSGSIKDFLATSSTSSKLLWMTLQLFLCYTEMEHSYGTVCLADATFPQQVCYSNYQDFNEYWYVHHLVRKSCPISFRCLVGKRNTHPIKTEGKINTSLTKRSD